MPDILEITRVCSDNISKHIKGFKKAKIKFYRTEVINQEGRKVNNYVKKIENFLNQDKDDKTYLNYHKLNHAIINGGRN